MAETNELLMARDHLAKAETMLGTEEGLFHLQEGLALLEYVIEIHAGTQDEVVARNLGGTYTKKIYDQIGRDMETSPGLPEPQLEHLFAAIRAFDEASFDLPPASRDLKIEVVKRLIDLYYEGYSQAEKAHVYQELAELSRNRGGT